MTTPTEHAGPQHWLVIVGIGLVGGILSGLFAIGGGIIMVPLLTTFAKLNQRVAAATSLAALIPTSIVGTITYLAVGEIDVLAAGFVSVGAIVGAILGSKLLKRIPLTWLRWMFIVFILLVAARLFFTTPVRGAPLDFSASIAIEYVVLGLAMGILSALFGIGGGIIAVPALISVFGISDLVAKGTSLAVMIPTSAVGTFTNWRNGTVDIRVGLVLGVSAAIASVPGAALSLALPARLSTVLFGILLVAVAAQLVHRALALQKTEKKARKTSA
ncbi:hypothetical protein B7R22_18375 [Subtercola boreus]|uniref:Probable membrane transporter protein n=1 Tax=Subtercola boreus TaxID=120213 RepID=A0A3E0VNY7_9MICO|nr:sulfite exporter TauE/SafE family protein [Subtercola boreus]RFA11682.1 hypothetical protein B7R22_18375 [Subtercola boreus]